MGKLREVDKDGPIIVGDVVNYHYNSSKRVVVAIKLPKCQQLPKSMTRRSKLVICDSLLCKCLFCCMWWSWPIYVFFVLSLLFYLNNFKIIYYLFRAGLNYINLVGSACFRSIFHRLCSIFLAPNPFGDPYTNLWTLPHPVW